MSRPATLRLRVTTAAESILRSGHPWLFADSVRAQNRAGQRGELAVVYDRRDQFLAVGLYDPDSPIRVRVLHAGKPRTLDDAWWRERLGLALGRREGLFAEDTTAYRLIHGESDGWPGLVLDRYGSTLVLKLYTSAWLPRVEAMAALVKEALAPEQIVLRLSRNIQELAAREFNRIDGQLVPGDPSPPAPARQQVTFLESGLRFEADVVRGQKTGFFLDQRENRRRVEPLAAGRDMLNAFSFSGGFSLYAARGGARSVTDLDLSPHALDSARRNFALNQSHPAVARCSHETLQADAFVWLEQNTKQRFDLVVLDPPSLAKRESERSGAIQAYARLAASGLKALRPGGMLVAASCSAHVSAEEFFGAVRRAARIAGRGFAERETSGHPPDHPATFPEARYLKCLYAAVS
jgi:23S rRNA (cytosine1962-C5)-methyltransferase